MCVGHVKRAILLDFNIILDFRESRADVNLHESPSSGTRRANGRNSRRPGRFTPGKETRYPLYRRRGGPPSPVWTCEENLALIGAGGGGFVFSCTLYFIRTSFFVFIVLHFAFCLYSQHKHPCPRRDWNPQPQQVIGCRSLP
jgi:hypothetical protein